MNGKGYWTYNEDRLILKTKNREQLEKVLSYRAKGTITWRIKRLMRVGYTLESLDYEENFIKEGHTILTQQELADHLKLEKHQVVFRIDSMREELNKLNIVNLTSGERQAFSVGKDKAAIMKEFNLKDYEYAVRKIIHENGPLKRQRVAIKESTEEADEETIKRRIKADLKKNGEFPVIPFKFAPPLALSLKDIQKRTYVNNRKYEVDSADTRMRGKKFRGRLLQETRDHITLRNSRGIRESFLKVDFKTGESRIKEM